MVDMESIEILAKLRGGDLRSIGKAFEVVLALISEPTLFGEVFRGIKSDNPLV
jgi:hypothetical protein